MKFQFCFLLVYAMTGIQCSAQVFYPDLCNPNFNDVCYSIECLDRALESTQCLILENMHRPKLPKEMKQCVQLKQIMIIECGYGELPEEIYSCPNLTYLNFCSDTPNRITNQISMCKNLIGINFANCRLSKLPNSIRKLEKLEFVILVANRFNKIPHAMYTLKSLKYLDIGCNPIPEKEIEKFRRIRPDVELIFEPIPNLN